jgi:hypothetical protein
MNALLQVIGRHYRQLRLITLLSLVAAAAVTATYHEAAAVVAPEASWQALKLLLLGLPTLLLSAQAAAVVILPLLETILYSLQLQRREEGEGVATPATLLEMADQVVAKKKAGAPALESLGKAMAAEVKAKTNQVVAVEQVRLVATPRTVLAVAAAALVPSHQ